MFDEPVEAIHFAQHAKRLLDPAIVSRGLRQIGERIRHDAADLPAFPAAKQVLKKARIDFSGPTARYVSSTRSTSKFIFAAAARIIVGLRGAIEAGDRDERQHHRLIGL